MMRLTDVTGPIEFNYYGNYLMELLKSVSIKDTIYMSENKSPKSSMYERDIGFFLINLQRKLYKEYKVAEGEVFTLINSDSLVKKNKGAEVPLNGFFSQKIDSDIRKRLGDTVIEGKIYCRIEFTDKTDRTDSKIIYFINKAYDVMPEVLEKLWFIDECGGGLVHRIEAHDYKKGVEMLYIIDFSPNTLSKEETERFKKYIKDFN